jgi:hypothetical protein
MKFLVFLFLCFFTFQFPLLAAEVTPPKLPHHFNSDHYPAYCLLKYDILAPNEDIYSCTHIATYVQHNSIGSLAADGLYNQCWPTFSGYTFINQGIVLKKQVFATFTLPEDYQNPCKLKSQVDPEDDEICNRDLDVNALVRSAFSLRFPLDLFNNFNPPSGAPVCPSFTITGQTFQLCYLNDLVASLKYVLLVVFIISSVMAL